MSFMEASRCIATITIKRRGLHDLDKGGKVLFTFNKILMTIHMEIFPYAYFLFLMTINDYLK